MIGALPHVYIYLSGSIGRHTGTNDLHTNYPNAIQTRHISLHQVNSLVLRKACPFPPLLTKQTPPTPHLGI